MSSLARILEAPCHSRRASKKTLRAHAQPHPQVSPLSMRHAHEEEPSLSTDENQAVTTASDFSRKLLTILFRAEGMARLVRCLQKDKHEDRVYIPRMKGPVYLTLVLRGKREEGEPRSSYIHACMVA